jgi:hypothetical protein
MRQRKGSHYTKPAELPPAGLPLADATPVGVSRVDLFARPCRGTIDSTVHGTIISRLSHAALAMTAMYWQAGAAFARINAMEFSYR